MSNHAFSRKKRQLKRLSKKLQILIGEESEKINREIQLLVLKIKRLIAELSGILSHTELKRIVGGAALLLGISLTNKAAAQSFGAPQTNPFGLVPAYYAAIPAFADLDNDGDLDLMVGEYGGSFQYYKNTGTSTNPQFSTPQSQPFGLNDTLFYQISVPTFADLDADGDMDLMVGVSTFYSSYGDSNLVYFENTGTAVSPQFAAPQYLPFGLISPNAFGLPSFVDLDSDGDMDLMVGEYDAHLAYYENTGTPTSPQFASPQTDPFGFTQGYILASPAFADLDNDGDMDLMVGELYGNLQYFENTGSSTSPQFASPVANPFGLTATYYYAFPAFADLDGDGDTDLLVGEYYGNMIYFEDTTAGIGIGEFGDFDFKIFPNPASNYVEVSTGETIIRAEILDISGRKIFSEENPGQKIYLKDISQGAYLLKLINADGEWVVRKLDIL